MPNLTVIMKCTLPIAPTSQLQPTAYTLVILPIAKMQLRRLVNIITGVTVVTIARTRVTHRKGLTGHIAFRSTIFGSKTMQQKRRDGSILHCPLPFSCLIYISFSAAVTHSAFVYSPTTPLSW